MEATLSGQFALAKKRRNLTVAISVFIVCGAMALDTKIIINGSENDIRVQAFSADGYAEQLYPEIRSFIIDNAVELNTLVAAIKENKNSAMTRYGVAGGIAPVIPIKFTATIDEGKSGIFKLSGEQIPEEIKVRIQTGPAINGTVLRDATGRIKFGQFKNQMEYQDVGAALNRVMKAQILDNLNRDSLTGKQVAVTGVFQLMSMKSWMITPVKFDVE